MKILIVDDEQLARDELRWMLAKIQDVEIVGEAVNIKQAQQLIERLTPDLVLLDIAMPEGDGFELLERLNYVPEVVFTTAYNQYALQAFEVNALDYLMKPIVEQRLTVAIDKVRSLLEVQTDKPTGTLGIQNRVFVKDGDNCWFVKVMDIDLMESIGNYTRLYFQQHKPMINRSLNQLEARLPVEQYMRASRSYIVNRDAIEDIENAPGNRLLLKLRGGHKIEMSRRQSLQLKKEWGL